MTDYDAAMDGMDGVDLDEAMADLELDEKDEDGGNTGTTTMLWDMTRPLVGNVTKIEFLKFEDDQDARTRAALIHALPRALRPISLAWKTLAWKSPRARGDDLSPSFVRRPQARHRRAVARP